MEHHPDKGGDTAIMQQVTTEFGRLFEAWKEKPDIPSTSTGYEYDYPGATAKEYTGYVYNEYRWKGRNYKGQHAPEIVGLVRHGSRRPIRDTSSLPDGRITTPSISG